MRGIWKNQTEIDRQKWDELVDNTPGVSIYACSLYLDATAIDWDAYIAEDFSYAIPIGTVKKGGVKRAYPPLFHGYIEPIGEFSKINWATFEKELIKRYPKGNIHLKSNYLPNTNSEKYIYQSVSKETFKLKSQAKRKIKLFNQSDYTIQTENINTDVLYQLIVEELAKKFAVFKSKDVRYLKQLIEAVDKKGFLYKVGVYSGTTLKGGLIGMKYKDELIYLKGATPKNLKQKGAMYALMEQFIMYGCAQNCTINFGGSRIEGVRFFYQRFNGKDVNYYHYYWDHAPIWFKMLYRLYSKVKRR